MEGELSLTETISDMGKYILYDENGEPIERNAPSCHTDYPSTHADQDLVKALTNSCNYYFFEVANRLGIERLNRWAERLGLTSLTGVEAYRRDHRHSRRSGCSIRQFINKS